MVRYYYAHGLQGSSTVPHAEFALQPQAEPQAPQSSWLIFATTDHDTQVRTQHARLQAEPAGIGSGVLELTAGSHGQTAAALTLGALTQAKCTSIGHVGVAFDGAKPEVYEAEPGWNAPACQLRIVGFERFVQSLLNAQSLVITPPNLQAVEFHVAGLTWDTQP